MRRTKIVATVGPATSTPEAMRALLAAGADVVRLNAAHGTPDVHAERADARARDRGRARPRRRRARRPARPEAAHRAGRRRRGRARTSAATFTLDARRRSTATRHASSTTVPELARWVRSGDDIFLADGAIVLRVERDRRRRRACAGSCAAACCVRARACTCRAPKAHVEPFTDADAVALRDGDRIKADFVGLSFVRRPEDVERGARPAAQARRRAAARREDRDRGRARPSRPASSARPTR